MDLYEYQARDMFESYGVSVMRAATATTAAEARQVAEDLGWPAVIKAQVKTGGRGKAGGVKLARDADEAQAVAEQILGMDIKGHTVHRVMVTEGADIAEEYYFSLLVDRSDRQYLAMCSRSGGVDIETLAKDSPELLAKVPVDPLVGVDAAKAAEITAAAGFDEADRPSLEAMFVKLWEVFRDEDATLVEVNPLIKAGDGSIIALDGKVTLDENAAFRHPEHAAYRDEANVDPLESQAREQGLNYVKLDGNVGVIGNGAGLMMSTLDVVAYAGADLPGSPSPANFLDIGGGASAEVMANGLSLILSDPAVKSIFVNVYGGITSCEQVAKGIVQAMDLLGERANKPIVLRLDGNNAAGGRHVLKRARERLAGFVLVAETMDGGARMAAQLAAGVASIDELRNAREGENR
ncbi:succinyl-CoA synthetase (ADP-forming) beta subunit [Raineyella antarctica]|uniref:Succinate--CoA ligase [ADP-forming] subunit beta n=1 Tax=Raineyella antarctica TaxID=1577474 RepID=A0A1G6H4P3_9ACTN|nr:ADP-forming succinate--CoA ligase subunit beta [Raineyella antarctica]SDB89317.1 succinyl-CoA synthetase (ADP-forming) beta subunit [Raineyella antarctica]